MTVPEDRDELLRALACGDLPSGSPEVVARLAADPELALRYESLRALAGRLDRSALEQRDILRDAARLPDPQPAGESARRLLELARAGRRREAPPTATRRPRVWFLAAAALLVVGAIVTTLTWRSAAPLRAPGATLDGREAIELVAPAEGARWDPVQGFRWRYDLEADDRFEVLIESADAAPFEFLHSTRSSSWIPSETERTGWPANARWSVRVRHADGQFDPVSRWRAVSFGPPASPR